MRGLNTRVLLAKARIMAIVDEISAEDMFIDVWLAAQADGNRDADQGIYDAPLMFGGEPQLVTWWKEGQMSYRLGVEMLGCSGCQNERGEPCHVHG